MARESGRWANEVLSTDPLGSARVLSSRPVTMGHPRIPVPLSVLDEGQPVPPTQQIPRANLVRQPLRLDPDPEVPVAEQLRGRRAHAAEQNPSHRSRVSWAVVALVAIVSVAAVCVVISVQGAPRDAAALGFLSLCLAAVLSLVAVIRRPRR